MRGHGGHDPGAVGNGIREKDIVLEIGLQMSIYLRENYEGMYRRMSRNTDIFVPLADRTRDANNWGADLFVSIHTNAFNGQAQGYEDFIHTSRTSGSQSAQNLFNQRIIDAMRKFDGSIQNRGKKAQNFLVLRETSMPAILTENLFTDNARDANLLKRPEFISAVAAAHAEAAATFLGLRRITSTPAPNPKPNPPPDPKPIPMPEEEEPFMLEKAIVINSFVDFPVAELLAVRESAPIYLRRVAERGQVAKKVFVVGGSRQGLAADTFIELSGANRFETARKVEEYLS